MILHKYVWSESRLYQLVGGAVASLCNSKGLKNLYFSVFIFLLLSKSFTVLRGVILADYLCYQRKMRHSLPISLKRSKPANNLNLPFTFSVYH